MVGPVRELWATWWVIAPIVAAGLACDQPSVAARAVWINDEHVSGARTLHVYSDGVMSTRTLAPTDALRDADGEALLLELAPRGEGALVMAGDPGALAARGGSTLRAGYVDLAGGRALPLALPLTGATPTLPEFAAASDALWWVDPCAGALSVVPLDRALTLAPLAEGGRAVQPWTATLGAAAGSGSCPTRWGLRSASMGAVVFAVAALEPFVLAASAAPTPRSLEPTRGGEVVALRYPGRGVDDEDAAELARGALLGDVTPARVGGCVGGCVGLVDPEGASISVVSALGEWCSLQRWSWLKEEGEDEAAPAARCVWEEEGEVIAAISPTHYVIRRDDEVLRLNWRSGEVVRLPLFGANSRWWSRVAAQGRAVVMISQSGPMLRLAADRVELVNIEQTTCALGQAPVISPSGRWAAWTCSSTLGDGVETSGGAGLASVVRASVTGLERYDGVPMWALAIDDVGQLLLFSRGDAGLMSDLSGPSSSPRNLYVLQSDGELSRVDTLEPDPELTLGLGGGLRWIDAAPL
jgi:hypothetical protein